MGYSWCRLCLDKKRNGSREYKLDKISWPQGYLHYILEHNVIPSKEFYDFIMNRK